MTDDLARRRLLARLDAHAAEHPELVDHERADAGEWLAVLAAAPELSTSPPDLSELLTPSRCSTLQSLEETAGKRAGSWPDSPELSTPGSEQLCKSGPVPTLLGPDSVCKPTSPSSPAAGVAAAPSTGEE